MKQIKMSSADYREYLRAQSGGHYVGRSGGGVCVIEKTKEDKYRAEKVDGYDSRKEKRRADVLRLMEKEGEISDLREQVKYELVPKQTDENGRLLELSVSYVADFVYKDKNGKEVVEDTKGMRTREYIIKRKLMLWVHGIRIVEI